MSSVTDDAIADSNVSGVVATPLARLATAALSFIASTGLNLFLPPAVLLLSPLDLVAAGLAAWAFGRRTAIAIASILAGLTAASAAAILSPPALAAAVLCRWLAGVAFAELVVRATAAIASLRAAAERDPLTGLFNRRGFAAQAAIELARARRGQRPICLATFDLDDFKRVNDELGHAEGDRLLAALGQVLQRGRVGDVAGRLGGDEFALLMPETTAEAAEVALARIRGSGILALSSDDRCVTFTTGMAAFESAPVRVGELLEAADAVLIDAKRLRRAAPVAESRPAKEMMSLLVYDLRRLSEQMSHLDHSERVSLDGVLEALRALDPDHWEHAFRGEPLTSRRVSRMLAQLGVPTRRWRETNPETGTPVHKRGYVLSDLESLFGG